MNKKERAAEIVRFLASGVPGVGIYFLILWVFTTLLGVWYLLSSIVACVVNNVISFYLQKYFAFRSNDKEKTIKEGIGYAKFALFTTMANSLFLFLFVEMGMYYIWAQVLATAILTTLSYLYNAKNFKGQI